MVTIICLLTAFMLASTAAIVTQYLGAIQAITTTLTYAQKRHQATLEALHATQMHINNHSNPIMHTVLQVPYMLNEHNTQTIEVHIEPLSDNTAHITYIEQPTNIPYAHAHITKTPDTQTSFTWITFALQ